MREHARNLMMFYLGLPAVVGFLLGTNQTGIGRYLPWGASVGFWLTATLLSWLVFHLGTVVAAYLLRPWEPPLIVKLAVGLLIASMPARLLLNGYATFFAGWLSEGQAVRTLPTPGLNWDFVGAYARTWSGPYVLWISANVFFDRIVGLPRYRPRPRHEARQEGEGFAVRQAPLPDDTPSAAPALPSNDMPAVSLLLSRLPPALGFDILAIKSEDHYLRVFTERGDTLILYKLSLAIEELETLGYSGLRVHRSWWVRREAIERVRSEGRSVSLTLTTGLEVPVSQTYRESVRAARLVTC